MRQDAIVPHAAAVVCHGGFGTFRSTLALGVPMVVVPLFADQPIDARRLLDLDAGLVVEPGPTAAVEPHVRAPHPPRARSGEGAARVAEETRGSTADQAVDDLRWIAGRAGVAA